MKHRRVSSQMQNMEKWKISQIVVFFYNHFDMITVQLWVFLIHLSIESLDFFHLETRHDNS